MILYLYPEGDGAPDKNIFTGDPNIPMGYRGDVGLVGAPTPIRLVTLENLYGPVVGWEPSYHPGPMGPYL